ncbi:MAG: hypothetical protein AAGJ08_08020 [Cyanobacteria bacterium P01_H01_bin.35]
MILGPVTDSVLGLGLIPFLQNIAIFAWMRKCGERRRWGERKSGGNNHELANNCQKQTLNLGNYLIVEV